MDAVDIEGCAWSMLVRADLVRHSRPRGVQMAVGMGLRIKLDAKPGRAWFEPYKTVHVNATSDMERFEDDVAHETSHAGMTDYGVAFDEQEPHADEVTLCWRIPGPGVRRLVRRHGFIPEMLVRFYRKACGSPVEILRRCAYLCGVAVIVHSPASGRVVLAEGMDGPIRIDLPAKEEKRLVADAKRYLEPVPGPFGVVAWPYRHGRSWGVAIVLDLDRALVWEEAG